MDNPYDEIIRANQAARDLHRSLDRQATSLAELLVGRLKHVALNSTLAKLKHELQDYNIHTGKWKP